MLSGLITNTLEGTDYNCKRDALAVCSILTTSNKFDAIIIGKK